jgi:hypothetical protein
VTTKNKKCSKCGEVKEVGEYNKNKSKKDGLGSECRYCAKCNDKNYRENNKDKISKKHSNWRKNNYQHYNKYNKEYRKNNKYKIAKKNYDWRKNNKEYFREYRESNKSKYSHYTAMRKAKKKDLTPPLTTYDKERIEALYAEAKRLEKETGAPYHVDHVWPINKGGVHHWCNLEVIPAAKNLSKSARHDGVSGVSYNDYMLAQQAI